MRFPSITYYSRRQIWSWLNYVWNSVDNDRIKEVGPDLACAEWLMRNGAFVKWSGFKEYIKDYDVLTENEKKATQNQIEAIDATDSSIMHVGFPYFRGCKYIKRIRLQRCSNIEDKALKELDILKDSLQHLQIISCGNVTDNGIKSLTSLVNLETLFLFDLPEVKCREECLIKLQKALPKCQVDYLVTERPSATHPKLTEKLQEVNGKGKGNS